MATNSGLKPAHRAVLGAVARREVFQDYYARTWVYVSGGSMEIDRGRQEVLADLEHFGFVTCHEKVEGERVDRFYELTDKALELPDGVEVREDCLNHVEQ